MVDPEVKIIVSADDQASGVMGGVGQSVAGIGTSVNSVQMGVRNLVSGMSQLAGQASGFAHDAVSTFAEFDTAMTTTTSITSGTNAELEKMEELAVSLAREYPILATEAANGMYQLASAGKSANEIMELTPAILELSIASAADFATTARLVTAVQDSWQLSARQVNDTTDILMNTVKSSKTTMDELAISMQYVATTAANLGVEVPEVSAAIGVLRNLGLDASTAGTGLRMVFMKLAASMGETEGAIGILGKSLVQTKDGSLDFTQTMKNLNNTLSNYDPVERQAILTEAFGARAATAASILMNESDSLKDLTYSMQESGTTHEIYEEQAQSAGNQIKIMEGQMEQLEIEIGENLMPAEMRYLEMKKEMLDVLTKMPGAMGEYGGAAVMASNDVLSMFGPLMLVMTGLSSLKLAMGASAGAGLSFSGVMAGIVAVLTGPIMIVLALVAALAGVAWYFTKIDEEVGPLGRMIMRAVNPFYSLYMIVFETEKVFADLSFIISNLIMFFSEMPTILSMLGDFFKDMAKQASDWGGDFIQNYIDGIVDGLTEHGSLIEDAVGEIADFFGGSPPHKGPLYDAMISGGPSFVEEYTGNMGKAMASGNQTTVQNINFAPSFSTNVSGGGSGIAGEMDRIANYTIEKFHSTVMGGAV